MEQQLQVQDFIQIARRRLYTVIAVFLVFAVLGVFVVQLLPPVYRSSGIVAVESQQIPDDLVRSTVRGSADQAIGFIQQVVLTDARLEQLMQEHQLYEDELASSHLPRVIQKLRDNVAVEAIRDPYGRQAVIAFTVSFDHTEPATAQAVATELTELFLVENAQSRHRRASETVEFLRRETERLNGEARALEQQVADFKQGNSDALPEHLTMRVNMLQQAEFDLQAVRREIAATEQERRFLTSQMATLNEQTPVGRDSSPSDLTPEQRLHALRRELASATAAYTEAHPDVSRLRRLVAKAEAEVRAQKGGNSAEPIAAWSPERSQLQANIVAAESRLNSLIDQEKELNARLSELRSQIMRTAEVEQSLREVDLSYQQAVHEYSDVRSKLREAELAESLESQEMAERFTLVQAPTLPVLPDRPHRPKLAAVALLLSLGSAVAVAFVIELLDKRVHDVRTLMRLIGERPFGVIPYISRAQETRTRIFIALTKWIAFASILAALTFVGHQNAEPLSDALASLYY